MPGRMYAKRNGEWVEIEKAKPVEAHFVHDDTLPYALRHPVTGEKTESLSRYERINKETGCKVVGNDLMSESKQKLPDRITDEIIFDRIHRAEAKYSDPTFRRHFQEQQKERLARRLEHLYGNR